MTEVEFKIIVHDKKEAYENHIKDVEFHESSLPSEKPSFYNQYDKISKTVVDLNSVSHFYETHIYCNDLRYDGVCIITDLGYDPVLLVSFDTFKKIYEEVVGVKIKSSEEFEMDDL